jgi:hypothetical protein
VASVATGVAKGDAHWEPAVALAPADEGGVLWVAGGVLDKSGIGPIRRLEGTFLRWNARSQRLEIARSMKITVEWWSGQRKKTKRPGWEE